VIRNWFFYAEVQRASLTVLLGLESIQRFNVDKKSIKLTIILCKVDKAEWLGSAVCDGN